MERESSVPAHNGEVANHEPGPDQDGGVDAKARELAGRYLVALSKALQADGDAFGLRRSLLTAGGNLVVAVESLRTGTAEWLPEVDGEPEERQAAFLEAFSRQVAGTGGLVADAVIRQAATDAGTESLLASRSPLHSALREGKLDAAAPISDDLFCLLFELFFKKSIAHFITVMVSGKVQVLLPVLYLIDPAGRIGDWVGEQVAGRIPDPCEKHATLGDKPTLADLASGMLTETIDRVLGLHPPDVETAAA